MFSKSTPADNAPRGNDTADTEAKPEIVSDTRDSASLVSGTKEGVISLTVGLVRGAGTLVVATPIHMVGGAYHGYADTGSRGAVVGFFSGLGTGVVDTAKEIGSGGLKMGKQVAVGTIRTPMAINGYMHGYIWDEEKEAWVAKLGSQG